MEKILALASDKLSVNRKDKGGYRCVGRNAYGFLFHAEVTQKIIETMVNAFAGELKQAGIDGEGIVRKANDYLPGLQRIGASVFRRWTALLHRSE